jgi:hypothetical protein
MDDDVRVIDQLRADSLLGQFFYEDFNGEAFVHSLVRADVSSFDGSSTSLEESPVERTLHHVRQRAGQLDVAIRDLVTRHQDALVSQASAAATLKKHIVGVHERVNAADDGLRRIDADVMQPYAQLKADSLALRNATLALEMLRRVQRAHQNIRRLRTLAGGQFASAATTEGVGLGGMPAASSMIDARSMARVAPLLREAALVSVGVRFPRARCLLLSCLNL